MVAQIQRHLVQLSRAFQSAGLHLPLKKTGSSTHSIHGRVIRLSVCGGRLVARTGGGYSDMVDILAKTAYYGDAEDV